MKEQLIDKLITEKTANLAEEKGFEQAKVICQYVGDKWGQGYTQYCTQSLLQKWLREKHNIVISVMFELNEYEIYIDKGFNVGSYGLNETFKTFEQALEKGLIESLRLIK